MKIAAYALAGLTLAIAGQALAEDVPKHLLCEFKSGSSWSYADGKFVSGPTTPLSFEIERIDLEGQSAALKTAEGTSGTLRIVRAINANHFLEVVNEGFLNLTTVFDKEGGSALYPAVHSRHFGILGQPLVAQYTGSCREK